MKLNTVLIYMSVMFHSWDEGSTQDLLMSVAEKEQMPEDQKQNQKKNLTKFY